MDPCRTRFSGFSWLSWILTPPCPIWTSPRDGFAAVPWTPQRTSKWSCTGTNSWSRNQGDGFMFQPKCQVGHLQPSIAESETPSKAPAIVLRWIIEDLPSKFKEGKPWISGWGRAAQLHAFSPALYLAQRPKWVQGDMVSEGVTPAVFGRFWELPSSIFQESRI